MKMGVENTDHRIVVSDGLYLSQPRPVQHALQALHLPVLGDERRLELGDADLEERVDVKCEHEVVWA